MASDLEIIDMVAQAFGLEPGTLTPESGREEIDEWDSMGMLMLMAELDERYDLIVEEEVLAGLETVADIVKLVRAQGDVAA
ncbi:MAG: acyl carrier protein [Pseudomonadota bacterium]